MVGRPILVKLPSKEWPMEDEEVDEILVNGELRKISMQPQKILIEENKNVVLSNFTEASREEKVP